VPIDLSEELTDPDRSSWKNSSSYQQYKKLSELIGEKEKDASWLLDRNLTPNVLPFPDEDIWEKSTSGISSRLFRISSAAVAETDRRLYEEVTINEKSLYSRALGEKKEFHFSDVLAPGIPSSISSCAFFALLEMVKFKEIVVIQNKLFGDIRIRRSKRESRPRTPCCPACPSQRNVRRSRRERIDET